MNRMPSTMLSCIWIFVSVSVLAASPRPNVLFIAVDDLRPELGCYGAEHIHSPNIDAFAASGRLFEHAYCQQSVCNPSRTSVMTGMRPDTTGVTGNHSHFRDKHPEIVTLPQYFKQHGYQSKAIGKIYHGVFPDGSSNTQWDTMGDPDSWSTPAIRFGPRYYFTEAGIAAARRVFEKVYEPRNPAPDDWTKKLVFGPATEAPDVPDNALYDGKVAEAAVKTLREWKQGDNPFFLAVGFIKPHSPYTAPKKYFDLYRDIPMADDNSFPDQAPGFAGHGSGELRRYTDQPKRGVIPDANQRQVRQAYFACVSYIDAQIGRVLNELDRSGLGSNTIVLLWGDHGYHLGEQGLWGKTTNFELDTRVPLIVRTPGMKSAGTSAKSLVELVDLYPTLAELAGLNVPNQLEGKSFAKVLQQPDAVTKKTALSQYPRGAGLMGYSMRTPTHRLTHWVQKDTGEIHASELYDYSDGLIESANCAKDNPDAVARLTTQLEAAFDLQLVAGKKPESDVVISFEDAKPGIFKKLETAVGTWIPEAGKTIVDRQHAKTGKQCLQLTGGENSSVLLELGDDVDTSGQLSFWAERWTARKPFSFRIEKETGAGWTEIYNGDAKVRVGRAFLNHVKVPINDRNVTRLRLRCISPPNTGILIDDLRIAPARPQKILSVEAVPVTLPALLGVEACPLVKLRITTAGQLNPLSLSAIKTTLLGDLEAADFAKLFVYPERWDPKKENLPWHAVLPAVSGKGEVAKTGTYSYENPLPEKGFQLAEGENTVWIAVGLKADADIDTRVGVQLREVSLSNGQTIELDAPQSLQRLGVAVRKGGDDGVHTYRIPGLATTNQGTLIGVYDVRRRGGGDLPGDIDVGMSRSTDGGRTWEPMKTIMDMGNDPRWRYDGIGDPAVLVDRNRGTIWVAATWSHGNRSWIGSGPGLSPEETGQLMLVRSDDDGVTWSEPINITSQVKRPEWCFILQGPGKGITMQDGTIVFAAQYQDPPDKKRLPHSTIIYSKDHGKTWQVGTGAFDDTTESQVVEIEPGVLMLNCRYNRKGTRVVMTTRDMGKTWQKHATSERALIEPGACMASLIDVGREAGEESGNWLLFSNPDSTRGRNHITIKASPDRGLTWPKQHRLLLDEHNSAGYSCMTMIDKKTVGILYEGSQAHMTFQRIPLDDLVETPADAAEPANNQSLRLPQVFSDHMVLQAGIENPVWGHGRPGETVTVAVSEQVQKTVVDTDGNWSVRLKPRKASAVPLRIRIQSAEDVVELTDVLVGEVWVCAGQSNMEWMLRQSAHGKEELESPDHPDLRLLHLRAGARGSGGIYREAELARLRPEKFCEGQWEVASGDSAPEFSAVAWYFGRYLQEQMGVPVGLICPAVGGSPTEAWIPREALQADQDLAPLVDGNWLDNIRLGEFCRTRGIENLLPAIQSGERIHGDEWGPNHSFKPGFMWDAGIQPLIPYGIRGVLWYQGESNAETAPRVREHGQLFPLLIRQWREHWGQGDFPFFYVQLPALKRPQWPAFRDGQRRILDQLENVGMAVTIDTGHPSNVHPELKKPVGRRLAKLALGTTYGRSLIPSGPLFVNAERDGDSLVVSFKHSGGGLKSSDGQPLRFFEVCGKDGVFHAANAKIIRHDAIAVSSSAVSEPMEVRYAWLPYPEPSVNLFNGDDLPASPFSSEVAESVFASEKSAMERPNILFIVSEDNSEHLGCYGEQRVHTPHLDSLASGGVRYTRAYVPYSVCSPSRAAFLTGLYPRQTGHIGLATHRFAMYRDFKTMPAYFREAGYYTGFLGKTHVNPERLVEDHVDHRAIRNSNFSKTISIEEYAEEAHAVMQKASDLKKPFLLLINYADAHRKFIGQSKNGFPTRRVTSPVKPFPWIGSDTVHLREELRDYFNCMNRLDEGVGMVLDRLEQQGVRDRTLVIYISDHGADFPRGKGSVYEHGTRIPMIVNYPSGFPQGKAEHGMVSTIDILPTMLRAARLPIPDDLPGMPLQDVASGELPPREFIHTFTTGSSPNLLYMQFGIRDDRYKLVFNPDRALNRLAESRYHNSRLPADQYVQSFLRPPEYELFDLREDPNEWNNLADVAAFKPMRERLLNAMRQFQMDIKDPFAKAANIATFISEQKEYAHRQYRKNDFRWPHLDMFKTAQESGKAVSRD